MFHPIIGQGDVCDFDKDNDGLLLFDVALVDMTGATHSLRE